MSIESITYNTSNSFDPAESLLIELRDKLPLARLESLDRGFALFTIVGATRALSRFAPGDYGRWLHESGITPRQTALVDLLLCKCREQLEVVASSLELLQTAGELTFDHAVHEIGALYESLDEMTFDGRDVLDGLS